MHVAGAAFATLFRAFLAMAAPRAHALGALGDQDEAAEGTVKDPKRRRRVLTAEQKARWVLCFTHGGANSCPTLDVRRLDRALERKWNAGTGSGAWRDIIESADFPGGDAGASGDTACRLYGPFYSRDSLSHVSTLLRRLFLLRCTACSGPQGRESKQGGVLRWQRRPQHRMAALLAEAVCREATHRCRATPSAIASLLRTPQIPAAPLPTATLRPHALAATVAPPSSVPDAHVPNKQGANDLPAGPIEQALLTSRSIMEACAPASRQTPTTVSAAAHVPPCPTSATYHQPPSPPTRTQSEQPRGNTATEGVEVDECDDMATEVGVGTESSVCGGGKSETESRGDGDDLCNMVAGLGDGLHRYSSDMSPHNIAAHACSADLNAC